MGVFSEHLRYRNPGEQANVPNLEEFGYPVKSLFTSTKVLTLHHHIDITDENGSVVYQSNTKFPSIRDKTDVTDAMGNQVAHIERKIFTLRNRHFVTMGDGTQFQVASELLHLIKDIINIENLCNLDKCGSELFRFSCFPIKIKDSDGAAARAVAWFE